MNSLVLPPLSMLYGAITRTRASLYEHGAFRSVKLSRPVISVGNITVGGTGKTPLVEWVVRTLASSGRRVCILTRGYGRENPRNRVVVSDGDQVFSNPTEAGDEPFLLARNLEGIAAVISDANRFSAGQDATKHLGSDCFVLDDGFQHLQLVRNLNIVTIDATNPWGGNRMLPIGTLREPLAGLKRADCLVLTRCDQAINLDQIEKRAAHLSGDRPLFRSRMVARGIVPLHIRHTPAEPQSSVAAFCGVGNPASFFTHVQKLGYEIAVQKEFPDHHRYSQADIEDLVHLAQLAGAKCLVTTAKDAVKLEHCNFQLPVYALQIEISIDKEEELRRLILASIN